jgi:response regulator RpfG family c-di-GMP phosphodiesterase
MTTTTETPLLSPSSLADREQAWKVAVLLVMAVATSKGSYPEHSLAVANLSRAVGVELVLGEEALQALELGALLHDVGKLGVPGALLHKSGPLTPRARVHRAPLGDGDAHDRADMVSTQGRTGDQAPPRALRR